ncbi:MAG: DNA polymerase III subunit alpha [Cytophagales bacterium]|nr:DNA polymerase III subunit alpha [Cytophagales bacterium]
MFVHLRTHSEFSVVDGTTRIDELVKAAAASDQPALALTDLSNLYGAIKFYKEARGAGVKPIVGADVWVQGIGGVDGGDDAALSRLVLLVQNQQGYLHLCELLGRAWTDNLVSNSAVMRWEWVAEKSAGLIALSAAQSGAAHGALAQALMQGDAAKAEAIAARLAGAFENRFYIELQRAGRADDEAYIAQAVALAAKLKLPVVATHPVQFMTADDYEAHEARICIADGDILGNQRRARKYTVDQYFKSSEEMEALFADIPSAISNTVEIAKRCNISLVLGKPQLPDYPTPVREGQSVPIADYFRELSFEGLEERLALLYPDADIRDSQRARYVERLEFEINTILKMGFPGYFLIVGDFINWAKNNGCPVGPGRGSGAGSLVAYVLKITDLDPLQYNLLFERFLNPDRVSMPDFDIDFCQGNRDRVIDYVKQKYGLDAVSQIVTFGTMAARAAIRDVGRVLDLSYTFVDGISKLIPNKPGQHMTIAKALEVEPLLAERLKKEEDVKTLLELAQKLEGLTRNVGMHAGGVLIAPGKLTDFCPLYQQPGSESAVSQFDKDDVEAIGLVKFDFLGLATLTILEMAKKLIRSRRKGQENFIFDTLPLDDARVYKLFADGNTEAVFQFESRGMQIMLREAKPTRLEDLIALNALYRPGPMDLIPSFVARKQGREEVIYPHPLVAEMLSETYGIMVYQEQVMQTAQILGGYSLGGADLLRRAMGKKKAEEMAEHRTIFRAGAAKNGISNEQADEIFDLMEKFAGYGFNKSHAAAYSLLAYHTGWLKYHYAAEFYCANMTVEMGDTDKLKVLFEDAQKNGVDFEAPDVNRSVHDFVPVSDTLIRYGLGAIKGTGRQAIEAIVAAREADGEGAFKSLFDFMRRVDKSKLNKRTVEALIKAGAFDSLHPNRAASLASVDLAFDFADAQSKNANQVGLFDMGVDDHGSSDQEPPLAEAIPWGVGHQLTMEKTALGFCMSGHLFDANADEVRRFVPKSIGELAGGQEGYSREVVLLAGIVGNLRVVNGHRGKMALFKLDDKSGVMDATAEEALINANKDLLVDDSLIIVQAKSQPDRFSGGNRLVINKIWDLASARCRFGKYLSIKAQQDWQTLLQSMRAILTDFPPRRELTDQGEFFKGLSIRFEIEKSCDGMAARAQLQLGESARFFPSDAALASWYAAVDSAGTHSGAQTIKLVY